MKRFSTNEEGAEAKRERKTTDPEGPPAPAAGEVLAAPVAAPRQALLSASEGRPSVKSQEEPAPTTGAKLRGAAAGRLRDRERPKTMAIGGEDCWNLPDPPHHFMCVHFQVWSIPSIVTCLRLRAGERGRSRTSGTSTSGSRRRATDSA